MGLADAIASSLSLKTVLLLGVVYSHHSNRPVDLLATSLCAPLADYMPGVRQAIVAELPRSRLALSQQNVLARRPKREG